MSSGDSNSVQGEGSAIEVGRQLISDWDAVQPPNFFVADVGFQRVLEFHWGRETYRQFGRQLYHFGAVAAGDLDALVRETNQDGNLPELNRFDLVGKRIEEVKFHPSHHQAGRHIYGSNILSVYEQPCNNLLALALFYLSSQNGEAGHNCPVACSAGMIKALKAVGSEELRDKYVDQLLDPDYDVNFKGAQYLTEVQGGSDVGANATFASPIHEEKGLWIINGEKWFCSNVTADLSLVTARVSGQGVGTKGLGLFILPRYLETGQLNEIYIRRLKQKLGTRSMATGEIDLKDAVAYQVGPVEDGFRNVMSYVINTSRVYNAVGICGNARRALSTALSYAQYRTAFGHAIIHFPIIQDMLATMRADVSAILSGTFTIIKQQDILEQDLSLVNDDGFLRLAINLNKYRSAVLGHNVILKAIEILGGNGAIESFSVLPRLLRDNIVYENWEGSHNVLLAQAQRDIRNHHVHIPFMIRINQHLTLVQDDEFRENAIAQLETIGLEMAEVMAMDELTGMIYFRPLMNRLTDLYYTACMAKEGQWELQEKGDRTKIRLAKLFFNKRVLALQPKDIHHYDDQVSRLCQ